MKNGLIMPLKGYKSLLRVCKIKHKNTKWAKILWENCTHNDKSNYLFKPEDIPTSVGCLWLFEFPIRLKTYLDFEKKFSETP